MKTVKLLLFLLLFLLPTQLGKHFWFDFSYKLGARVDYLSPTIYFTDVLVFIIIIAFFLKRSHLAATQGVTLKKDLLVYCFIGLLFFTYWLFIVKENPYLLAYNLFKLGEMVALGLIIAKTFSRKDFPRIITVLNWGLILQVFLAGYQVIVEKSAGLWIIGERNFSISTPGIAKFLAPGGQLLLRGYGTFPHPNVFGGFCLLMLVGNIWFVKGQSLRYAQGLSLRNLNGLVFSLLGVVLSMSFTAWGLAVALLVFKSLRSLKILKTLKLTGVVLPLLVVGGLAFSLNSESLTRRTALLAVAGQEFLTSPVFGIGLSNFIPMMPAVPIGQIYFWQPVHNVVVLIVAETGLVGLGLAGYLIWRGFRNFQFSIFPPKADQPRAGNFQLKKKNAKNINVQIINYQLLITSWWFIIFLTGMVDHYWLTLQQGRLMLTLVVSLSAVLMSSELNNKYQPKNH